MNHPDFRVDGRIFATIGYPRDGRAAVALTPEDQATLVAMKPEAFVPVKGKWGEQGATNILLRTGILAAVVEPAWEYWVDDAPFEWAFGRVRLEAFASFVAAGIVTHASVLGFLSRRSSTSRPGPIT